MFIYVGQNKTFIASETSAFSRYTKNYIAMKDGEIGVVRANDTTLVSIYIYIFIYIYSYVYVYNYVSICILNLLIDIFLRLSGKHVNLLSSIDFKFCCFVTITS
jgi:hypothetical protein